jgi:uncharacterized Zn finger protein
MYRYFKDWETSGPRAVKDGIRAQSRGSRFASSWWGKRWLETLDGFGWDSRLQRGRSYARRGQVVDLALGPTGVTAGVQGSAPRPYRVRINLRPLSDAQWDQAVTALDERALFVGQLLAGEMPSEIEEVFTAAKVALFPQQSKDLEMSCSCPDWAVPCKHLAAVYYLLAEWLDHDPFLLFELRGRDRDALLAALRERHGADRETAAAVGTPDEPLSAADFWTAGAVGLDPGNEAPPAVPQAVLRALGDPPGWSEPPLAGVLRPVYAEVTRRATEMLSGGGPADATCDADAASAGDRESCR